MSPIERWDPDTGQLVERRSHPLTPWATAAATIMMGAIGFLGSGISGIAAGGGRPTTPVAGAYEAPSAPTATAVAFADTAAYINASAFSGSGDDTLAYTVYELDSLRGTGWNVMVDTQNASTGRSLRSDSIHTLTANDTFKVRALQHGGRSNQSSAWSAVDTFVASTANIVFQMDYSAGGAPTAGFSGGPTTGAEATVTRSAGAGPGGVDAYLHELTYLGDGDGDDYWSWGTDFGTASPPFQWSDTVYMRWRQKWINGTDMRGLNQGGGGGLAGTWRNKLLSFNENGGPTGDGYRLFAVQEGRPAALGGLDWRFSVTKGGGVDPANTGYFSVDTVNWVDVQVEYIISSGSGQADGGYSIWVDNNTYGSPDASVSNVLLMQGGEVRWGHYFNNGVYSDGTIGFYHADFEIGTTFDSSWNN